MALFSPSENTSVFAFVRLDSVNPECFASTRDTCVYSAFGINVEVRQVSPGAVLDQLTQLTGHKAARLLPVASLPNLEYKSRIHL